MPFVVPTCSAPMRPMTLTARQIRRAMSRLGSALGKMMRDKSPHPAQSEASSHFDHFAIHVAHSQVGIRIHRKCRCDSDECHLEGLIDSEPGDEERHHRQEGDGADHLHRRVDNLLSQRRKTGSDAQDQTRRDPQSDAKPCTHQRCLEKLAQLTGIVDLHQRTDDVARRGENGGRNGPHRVPYHQPTRSTDGTLARTDTERARERVSCPETRAVRDAGWAPAP